MSENYDNWERLVEAVSRIQQYRRLALSHSRTPSNTSSQSSSPSSSSSPRAQVQKSSQLDEIPTKCRWLGAKELQIEWGNDSRYWNLTSHASSRFPEVAELRTVWWFDIIGNIKTRLLSPGTTYAAFLVFKLVEGAQGLETANAGVRFANDEHVDQEQVQSTVVHLQPVKDTNGEIAVQRTDGWMEVVMGNFSFQNGIEGEVEARLHEHTTTRVKTGLIIDGIEFRPVYTKVMFVPSEVSRNRRGRGRRVLSRFSSFMINESFAVDWEKYVMLDYQEVLSSSVQRRYFPDGKICYMLGAKRLHIAWGDNPIHWKWRSHPDSRFSEIAELNEVWWLDLRGRIHINMLSPRTFYAAYLVFRLQEGSCGLDIGNTRIRFLGDDSEERARVVHLHLSENQNVDKAVNRGDGWMEVEMGNFYLAAGDEGEVEARLFETTTFKSGLIVEGIEFRPICTEISNTLSLDNKAVLPKIWIQGNRNSLNDGD